MSKYNLVDIHEGMSDEEWMNAKEEDRLEAHPDRDKIKSIQALIAKEREKQNPIKEMTGEIYSRIDGMIDQNLKAEFIDKFISIQEDFIESGEEFDALDVIDYLASEMQKYTVKSFMEEKPTEEAQRPGYNADGTPKSNDEMSDDEREDFYMNLDSVDENKNLQEHFGRFLKDYQ